MYLLFCIHEESVSLMPCRGKGYVVFEHTEFQYVMTSNLWCGIPGLRHSSVMQH